MTRKIIHFSRWTEVPPRSDHDCVGGSLSYLQRQAWGLTRGQRLTHICQTGLPLQKKHNHITANLGTRRGEVEL